jgi:hypothetical protein
MRNPLRPRWRVVAVTSTGAEYLISRCWTRRGADAAAADSNRHLALMRRQRGLLAVASLLSDAVYGRVERVEVRRD